MVEGYIKSLIFNPNMLERDRAPEGDINVDVTNRVGSALI
jgi:hypothetical protein